MTNLARRATACKHWQWMPGLPGTVAGRKFRIVELGSLFIHVAWLEHGDTPARVMFYPAPVWARCYSDALPDLTDPATIGCLLALVRDAWGEPGAHTERDMGGQWICWAGPNSPQLHDTEVAALVAALEAAP